MIFFGILGSIIVTIFFWNLARPEKDEVKGFVSFGLISMFLGYAGGIWVLEAIGSLMTPGVVHPKNDPFNNVGAIPFAIAAPALLYFLLKKYRHKLDTTPEEEEAVRQWIERRRSGKKKADTSDTNQVSNKGKDRYNKDER